MGGRDPLDAPPSPGLPFGSCSWFFLPMGLVSGEIGGPVYPTLQPRSASQAEASSSGVSAPLAPCSIAQRGREHPGGMPSERPARRDRVPSLLPRPEGSEYAKR